MKELKKALSIALLWQLIGWFILILCDENHFINQSSREMLSLLFEVLFLLVTLSLYFIFSKKIVLKYNYNKWKFNASLIILWGVFSIIMTWIMSYLISNELLHVCEDSGWDCFLNGFEYPLFGIGMIFQIVIVFLVKIFYGICKGIIMLLKTDKVIENTEEFKN